jgi:hypothetical protein
MRDQYVGDVSDFIKFSFLRALAHTDRRIGVAWYYNPRHDGRKDGSYIEWRDEPAWKRLDAEVFNGLSTLPERTVAALERASFWQNSALFHRVPMPARTARDSWGADKRTLLDSSELVFLDADNGLGKDPRKHATYSEVRQLRRSGRAVVFITFPGRTKSHDLQVESLHKRLTSETGTSSILTLRTCVSVPQPGGNGYTPRFRWFTILDMDVAMTLRVSTYAAALSLIPRVKVMLN